MLTVPFGLASSPVFLLVSSLARRAGCLLDLRNSVNNLLLCLLLCA